MNKSFKTVILITTVIAVVISICTIAFAYTIADFSNAVIPRASGPSTSSNLFVGQYNSDKYLYLYKDSSSAGVAYAFYVDNRCYVASTSNSPSFHYSVFVNDTSNNSNGGVSLTYDSTTALYYSSVSYPTSITSVIKASGIPSFASVSDGLAAVRDYVNDPNPPVVSSSLDVVVPNGYALYVSMPAETVTVQLSATMPYNSELFGTPWPTIINYVNNVISLPNVGDTVLIGSGWSGVEWEKSPTANTNIFGQTRYAVYSAYPSSGGWYVVYNPAVSWDSNLSDVSNPSILAHFSKAIEYRLFPTADGVISGVQSITLGNPWESTADDNWQVTPPPGQDIIPPSGGNNSLPDDTGVEGILNRLVEMIRSIFEVAWRPIQEILQSVSGFFEKLADLWSWLPTEVSSLLIAGLTVIVAVGVLKSFL